MYNVPIYKASNEKEILDFLAQYPFAVITGIDNQGKPVAAQLPVLVEKKKDDWYFVGHMMKNTDHYKSFLKNSSVLAVFSGPSAYVSALWYNNPYKASTWNYMSVHAKGVISFFEGEALKNFMKHFTLYHEKQNKNAPTVYDNLSSEYLNNLMPHIIGFKIKIDNLDTVFKLSQDLDKESYMNVIQELEVKNGFEKLLAAEMKKKIKALFK